MQCDKFVGCDCGEFLSFTKRSGNSISSDVNAKCGDPDDTERLIMVIQNIHQSTMQKVAINFTNRSSLFRDPDENLIIFSCK